MAQVNRSKATLRLIGEELNPQEISDLLGCEGTTMYSKGDVHIGKKSGKKIERKRGHWSISVMECGPENINGQVKEILNKLTEDQSVWDDLSSQYSIDLFCGLFMKQENEGMEISPTTLFELGKRGVTLSLDIYDGAE